RTYMGCRANRLTDSSRFALLAGSLARWTLAPIVLCCLLALQAQTLPPRARLAGGLRGHLSFDNELLGDIWVHGQFVYLGTFSCGSGVKVVDAGKPRDPQLVATLLTDSGATYEDVIVISADTGFFHGDLLAAGLQRCQEKGAHGVQFWDVTDPRHPEPLGFFDTGEGVVGVHELYMFQRDDRIFALLAVPGSEGQRLGGDFRIVDATD